MNIKIGKQIDSLILKRNLNKYDSVRRAKAISLSVRPGQRLKSCPLCGGLSRDKVRIYSFCYAQCSECGALFVLDPPKEESLVEIYHSREYSASNKELLANEDIIDYRLNEVVRPKFDFVTGRLTTKNKRWLDVGCGVGELVKVASDAGWDALGIETNPMEREWGRNRFKIRIEKVHIDETSMKKFPGYGVVSLINILEHFRDPVNLLRSVSIIQERGDNLVVEVPHYPSLSAFSQIAFPEYINRYMHPPLHLFLFTIKSLEMLLGGLSYEITDAWYFGQDFYEFISTLGMSMGKLADTELMEKLNLMTNEFQGVIDRNKLSDQILIVAKKR